MKIMQFQNRLRDDDATKPEKVREEEFKFQSHKKISIEFEEF